MDNGSKSEQFCLIENSLTPSLVIESKNGFHAYWHISDGTADAWQEIVEFRLCPHFNGDLKAKDYCRVLRAPGYNHLKDPTDPFPVRVVFESNNIYRSQTLLDCFPSKQKDVCKKEMRRHIGANGTALSEKIYNMDCIEALSRLSGTAEVAGETYSFRSNGNNKHNIIVNGKSTSCFIDEQGRIGASPGGPTIWRWLMYFNHTNKQIVEIMKKHFPEIWS